MLESFRNYFATTPTGELIWIAVGLVAQLMFSARFLVQWIASERAKASVMPVAFWYFSLAGGLMLQGIAELSVLIPRLKNSATTPTDGSPQERS